MDYVTPFITWLLKSPYIKKNKLFLNAIHAQDGNIQIITQQVAENQIKRFVDGSKEYPLTFSIVQFKSASYNPLVKTKLSADENLSDIIDINKIIEFVKEMDTKGDYPEFSDNITVQRAYCQYNTPPTPAFDGSLSPVLSKFIIPVVFEVYEDVE